MKRNITGIIFGALILGGLSSCSHDRSPDSGNYDPNNPGYEYAPEGDMYHSVPYDPLTQYSENSNPYNPDSMNMRLPVKGTIARGHLSYYYPYTIDNAGYEKAGAELKNPIVQNPANLAEGKRLFETYCWQCHGKEGATTGSMVAAGKFPRPTWDMAKTDLLVTLPEGKMFHSITFGRNLMGPHGSILSPDQRWMIIHYLKSVAVKSPVPNPTGSADTSKKAATGPVPNTNSTTKS